MKPGEIINPQSFLDSAIARYNPDRARARSNFEKGSGFIKKLKWEARCKYAILFPLELVLPFDPRTLETDVFNHDNPFPLQGSVHTSILALRQIAKENEAFATRLARTLNTSVENLKVDSEEIDQSDITLFHQIARIQYLTGYVQRLNTNTAKFKFGRTMGCKPTKFNDNGEVIATEGVGLRLSELENALISVRIQQLEKTYEPGGVNEQQPKEDLETKKKVMWKDRMIGNPYPMSVVQVVAFKINKNYSINDEDIELYTRSHRVTDVSYYLKMTREKMRLLQSCLGSVANDIHCDFIEAIVDVPVKEKTDKDIDYMAITPSATTKDASIFGYNVQKNRPYNEDIEGFEENYREVRDDDKQWSLDILQKSVFEFRIMSDATLLSEVQNALNDIDKAILKSSSLLEFSDITDKISGTLTTEIAEAVFDAQANGSDTVIDPNVLGTAPVDTQESVEAFEDGEDLADLMSEVLNDGSNSD